MQAVLHDSIFLLIVAVVAYGVSQICFVTFKPEPLESKVDCWKAEAFLIFLIVSVRWCCWSWLDICYTACDRLVLLSRIHPVTSFIAPLRNPEIFAASPELAIALSQSALTEWMHWHAAHFWSLFWGVASSSFG